MTCLRTPIGIEMDLAAARDCRAVLEDAIEHSEGLSDWQKGRLMAVVDDLRWQIERLEARGVTEDDEEEEP